MARKKSDLSVVLGHALKVTPRCKLTCELVPVSNIYQHVSHFSQRKQRIWDILSDDIQSASTYSKPWIAAGDCNAAGQNQLWGYTGSVITRSADDRFNWFISTALILVSSPAGATYWSPDHLAHRFVTLNHFLFDRERAQHPLVFDRPSWHPSHDHHALFCFAPMSLIPGRAPALQVQERPPVINLRRWKTLTAEWRAASQAVPVVVGYDTA